MAEETKERPQAAGDSRTVEEAPKTTEGVRKTAEEVPKADQVPKDTGASKEGPAVLLTSGNGRLLGEVSYSRQEPVAGANVVLVREGDPGLLVIGTTDVHGLFRFESIPEGTWTVGVIREGAIPMMKKGVGVHPPARCVLDFVLKKASGRVETPIVDLSQYEKANGVSGTQGEGPPPPQGVPTPVGAEPKGSGRQDSLDSVAPSDPHRSDSVEEPTAGGITATAATKASPTPMMTVQVIDQTMRPIREGRVLLRSRGPLVDPLRGATDGQGVTRLPPPDPGEYIFKVDVPGFLPARLERLVLGRTPPAITVVLTQRPLDYPSTPGDLLPEEKPVPPEGFPGGPPAGAAIAPSSEPAPKPGTAPLAAP